MRQTERDPGPAPDTDAMAELIVERYPIRKGETVTISAEHDPTPELVLVLLSGKDRYELRVQYLRDAKGRDVWGLVTDALDALFGSFLELDRAYRDLPQGTDIEYEGAFFRVEATRTVPELESRANRMLEHD